MNRKLLWIIKLIVYVALFFPAAYGWFILLYIVSDVPILQYILLIVGAALYIGLGILIFRFKIKKPEAASQTVPDRSAKIKQFKTGAVFFAAAILVIIGILLFPTFMRNMERPATAEIRCDFADGQSTQAHGVDGDVKCYKTQYANHTEAYMISAQWFLADAGYMVSLSSYGAEPPHTMPLSVFG